VILLTGQGDIETAVEAMQLGAENFLTKPVDMTLLAAAIARVAEKVRLSRQNARLRAWHEAEGTGSWGLARDAGAVAADRADGGERAVDVLLSARAEREKGGSRA